MQLQCDRASDMQPPDTTRQYVSALTVLFVSLFIGLPMWWKTTEVYRSPLPYMEISALASEQVPHVITLRISLLLLDERDIPSSSTSFLVEQLNRELGSKKVGQGDLTVAVQFSIDSLNIAPDFMSRLSQEFHSLTLEDFSALAIGLLPSSSLGHYTIVVVPHGNNKTQPPPIFISQHRLAVVRGDLASTVAMVTKVVTSVYGDTRLLQRTLSNVAGKQQERVDLESKRQMRASQGYDISFTLINPDPSQLKSSWNIEETTQSTGILLPFLHHPGVESLGNFTVSSQVFYYTDVKFHASRSTSGVGYYITPAQLPPMISSVESKLGSHVSQLPSLNFLIYVPKRSESPLFIASSGDVQGWQQAFLVPQWGGVIFYNLPEVGEGEEVYVRMEDVMPVFIHQLKMLLGVPSLSDDYQVTADRDMRFGSGVFGITDWQMDLLLTSKMVESISMATTSLLSLVQLLDKVKNMVISDHIQQEVVLSLESIQQCYTSAGVGNLSSAHSAAKKAMHSAETAFFDPSILELLYFPDDQKFAIYIPLFLPISIPIVLSSMAALKWIVSSVKSHKPKQE